MITVKPDDDGLSPIMFGDATGSEIMQRIAAPMIGGMITAPLLSMLVIPVVYRLLRGRALGRVEDPSPSVVRTTQA